ncbi:MAG: c-type cytochrome domain-containing protein, partial [Verrucomicrobiota bacterium]
MIRLVLLAQLVGLPLAVAAGPVDYSRDVAPILRDYCAGCHNESEFDGGLSVETFSDLMFGGDSEDKTAIVPGDVAASYLIQTVLRKAEPVMPPEKEPQLKDEEVELLVRWVEQGAKGPSPEMDLSILSNLSVPEMSALADHRDPVTAIAVSPDGKWRAAGRYGKVEIVSSDGDQTILLEGIAGKVKSTEFSSDSKQVLTASGVSGLKGIADLWDRETGERIESFGEGEHRDILFDATFSPDGSKIATGGYDRIIRLWDIKSGKLLRELDGHNGAVFDLAFSPDGTVLASASGDSTGKVWNVESGERLDTLNQPQGEQFRIAFTSDGRSILGVGADNRIRKWELRSRETAAINPVEIARFGHEDDVVNFAMSPRGDWLVTTSADRALKVWSLPDLLQSTVLPVQPDVIAAMTFLDHSRLWVTRLDGSQELIAIDPEMPQSSADGPVASIGESEKAPTAPKEEPPSEMMTLSEGDSDDLRITQLPARVSGAISSPDERDTWNFSAAAGEKWVFEIKAARSKSKLDSKIEILDAEGQLVERAVLQAVRDSWLTFRGKNSSASNDFRVHNWREMELNEYLFVNGEVIKLFHFPRGPDSGFLVYPGFGNRHTFFETTAKAHPLGQPCYIVRSFPAGSDPSPNGLP